jgi:hypothetical protein
VSDSNNVDLNSKQNQTDNGANFDTPDSKSSIGENIDSEVLATQKRMLELRQKSLEVSEAASEAAVSLGSKSKVDLKQPQQIEEFMNSSGDARRGDVSASTIGRMMGLVTAAEFKLLEGKLDLLSTRMNSLLVKMEKVLVMGAEAPTGSDLERIDVQIAGVRTLLIEVKKNLEENGALEAKKVSDKPTGGSILSNQD